MLSKSLFILITFACTCLANELNVESEENWSAIQDKLFSDNGESIGVDKTFELLGRLASIYKGGLAETNLPDRSDQVNALIEISNISVDKCDESSLLDRWSLLEYHSNYRANILPYLRHFWMEQFLRCDSVFAKAFRESINSLDVSLIEFMAQLRENVIRINNNNDLDSTFAGPFNFISKKTYKDAILAVMKLRVGPDTKFKQNKITGNASDFSNEFESTIKEPCRKIRAELEEPMMLKYRTFLYHKDLAIKIDPLALEWIENIQMCHKIALGGVQLVLDAYNDLTTKEKPGFVHRSGLRFLFARS